MEIINFLQDKYHGGIYSDTYEDFNSGGPKCAASMTNQFRITVSAISAFISLTIVYLSRNRLKNSRELDLTLVKNLNPNWIEKIIGYSCYITYIVMAFYKFYTRRGVYMHNPCHYVLLFSGILLTTKKSKINAIIFISYMRWLFCPISALIFPDTTGMDLPYEVEFFWIEHYLAAFIAPLALLLCGRYGFFKEKFSTLVIHQLFGFACHILYMRFIMLPQSLLTWANLNYSLCNAALDPMVPYFGNYYLLFADYYLQLASIVSFIIQLCVYGVLYAPIVVTKSLLAKPQVKPIKKD